MGPGHQSPGELGCPAVHPNEMTDSGQKGGEEGCTLEYSTTPSRWLGGKSPVSLLGPLQARPSS